VLFFFFIFFPSSFLFVYLPLHLSRAVFGFRFPLPTVIHCLSLPLLCSCYISFSLCLAFFRFLALPLCRFLLIVLPTSHFRSPDGSVGVALDYGLDDRGSRFRFPAGTGNLSLHHRIQNGSGAHPASYPVGTGGSFPGVKRPGREADHSFLSRAEFKECVELYLHSPIRLHGVVLS
jgi:hypothetical protein